MSKQVIRTGWALLLVVLMTAVASAGVREALIPEIAALAVGFWVQDKQIWRINRWQTVVMLTVVALVAVMIEKFIPLPLSAKLCMVFVFVVAMLFLFHATLTPAFAVGMLPVLLGTREWIYPLSVLSIVLILALGQYFMDAGGLRKPEKLRHPVRSTWRDVVRWLLLLLALLPLMIFGDLCDCRFCLAPPLVVAFIELANSKAGFRFRLVQTWLMLMFAALAGTFGCVWLCDTWNFPEPVAALLAEIPVFLLFHFSGKRFAPAAALALIPFVIPRAEVLLLPLCAAVGATYVIAVAHLFFIRKESKS